MGMLVYQLGSPGIKLDVRVYNLLWSSTGGFPPKDKRANGFPVGVKDA